MGEPGDDPLLPWADAVSWRQVPRAAGASLGPEVRPSFAWMGVLGVRTAYAYPEHLHATYELIGVRHGTYRCRLDGDAVIVPAGGLLVISPGQRHADQLEPPLAYVGLSFRLEGPPLIAADRPVHMRQAQADEHTLALLDRIEDEARRRDRVAGRVQDALLQELFWRLVRALPAAALDPAFVARLDDEGFPARFARACEALLGRRADLSRLATACDLSRSGLVAACRRHLGTTPIAALTEVRLMRARDLLRGGGHAVKDVAALCGFASQYHFSRAFKKRWGQAPSTAREILA